MSMQSISEYRIGLFDGKPDIGWLRPGWRGLRFYGRRAKAAILADDMALKVEMIARANHLLNVMNGCSAPPVRPTASIRTWWRRSAARCRPEPIMSRRKTSLKPFLRF
jgi:hypothetical protein